MRRIARLLEGLLGIRDRALLFIGFTGGFRRSELIGLDRDAVEIERSSSPPSPVCPESGASTPSAASVGVAGDYRGLESRSRRPRAAT